MAGFTRGAVYHHFSSKEEMFLAVVARRDEELLAGFDPDLVGGFPSDPVASARRWQAVHGDAASEVALRLELRSHALRSPALRQKLVAVQEAAVDATAAKLAKVAADYGVMWRFPVEYVAELLHAASHVAAERAALTGQSSEERMATFTDLILKGALEGSSEERE